MVLVGPHRVVQFERRLMGGASNPYLSQTSCFVAMLDGIGNKRDPGEPTHLNMYEEGRRAKGARRFPLNLLDALRQLDKNKMLRTGLGDELVDGYVKLKLQS